MTEHDKGLGTAKKLCLAAQIAEVARPISIALGYPGKNIADMHKYKSHRKLHLCRLSRMPRSTVGYIINVLCFVFCSV